MLQKMKVVCLIALLLDHGIGWKEMRCVKSGLNRTFDVSQDVCQKFVEPKVCTYAHLTDNNIKTIGWSDFEKYCKLRYLILDRNQITNISPFAFKNTDLRKLHLSGNRLSCIPYFESVASTLNSLQLNKLLPFFGVLSLLVHCDSCLLVTQLHYVQTVSCLG